MESQSDNEIEFQQISKKQRIRLFQNSWTNEKDLKDWVCHV
jgi:hypothetical protein